MTGIPRRWAASAHRRLLAILVLVTGLLCSAAAAPPPSVSAVDSAAIRALLLMPSQDGPQRSTVPPAHAALRLHDYAKMRPALETLYVRRGYRPLWNANGVPTGQAQAAIALLRRAEDFGLQPEDYQATGLSQTLQWLQQHPPSPSTQAAAAQAWAAFDVSLSSGLLGFVADLHSGRIDPQVAGFELPPTQTSFDAADFVAELAVTADPAVLVGQAEPPFIHYRLLKSALKRYRALAALPQLTALPDLPTPVVEPGSAYAGAPALRRLLIALGCLPAAAMSAEPRLDPASVEALRQFQWLHGLATDGRLGLRTYAALTTPISSRVRQIELTLERWRWLPALGGRTIIVNIPEFRLFAFASAEDREQGMLRMDVIVGSQFPGKRTPIFAAQLRTVIFRPYWDVPHSIVVHEILPKLAHEPRYLDTQHLELVSGQTDASPVVPPSAANLRLLALGRLRLRQRPGADNALGLVKFQLPNVHDVYLHDTPEGRLFGQARRTFSHGCIRVGDPAALGVYALQGAAGNWDREHVEAAMHGDATLRVPLAKPVQVLILYGTAVASEDGTVHFFDDVYGHDRTLQTLLDLPPSVQPSISAQRPALD